MFCEQCGGQLSEGARFCARCGAPVAERAPVSASEPAHASPPWAGPPPTISAPTTPLSTNSPAAVVPPPPTMVPPPPPPPAPAWGTPGAYPYAPPAKTNGFAVTSMVLGLVFVYWIGSILALVFGYIALSQIKRSEGGQKGRGMAIAGIVLGWIELAGLVLVIIIAIADSS